MKPENRWFIIICEAIIDLATNSWLGKDKILLLKKWIGFVNNISYTETHNLTWTSWPLRHILKNSSQANWKALHYVSVVEKAAFLHILVPSHVSIWKRALSKWWQEQE